MTRLTQRLSTGKVIIDIMQVAGNNPKTVVVERLADLEDRLESGTLVEIPIKRQAYIYHLIKRKSKYGVVNWCKRKIPWTTYVANIAKNGDDGLYFAMSEQAEARLQELREIQG